MFAVPEDVANGPPADSPGMFGSEAALDATERIALDLMVQKKAPRIRTDVKNKRGYTCSAAQRRLNDELRQGREARDVPP